MLQLIVVKEIVLGVAVIFASIASIVAIVATATGHFEADINRQEGRANFKNPRYQDRRQNKFESYE